ncbi:MAG: tetratricopeptide repeat protein [Thermodesulfobacteriota bacterium]
MNRPNDQPIVILHLSDLHFGWKGDGIRPSTLQSALDGLTRCLKRLEPDWNPTHLLITGDLGWSGNEIDYQEAGTWLNKFMADLTLEPEAVFLCPGNHDSIRPLARQYARPGTAAEADRVLSNQPIPDHFKKPFEKYADFCRDLGLPTYRLAGEENYLCGVRDHEGLRVACVNSAWFAQDDRDKEKLWIGLPLIKQMQVDGGLPSPKDLPAAPLTLTLMHHPKDFLNYAEKNALDKRPNTWDFLGRRCHFLLTGHTHGEVREADRIALKTWHLTGGATLAGEEHFNNFRLIRLEESWFFYRAYEFDPRDTDNKWSLKIESGPILFRDVPPLRLALELREPKAGDPPSTWLRPEYQFVPVVGRESERKTLVEWLEAANRFLWKVVIGDGGMGKTRLAQELALEYREQGWEAGFLERDNLANLVDHSNFDQWIPHHPTLVIVDYAAGKVEPLKKLLKRGLILAAGNRGKSDTIKLRVLLLERSAEPGQGWLRDMANLEGAWGHDLEASASPILKLDPPAEEKAGLTENMFQIARTAMDQWSRLTKKKAPAFPKPDEPALILLAHNTGGRPLYLQMAALKACFEGRAENLVNWRREDLVQDGVKRERDYLARQSTGASHVVRYMVERAIALLCLTGPLPSDDPAWLKLLSEEARDIGCGHIPPIEIVERLGPILSQVRAASPTVLNPIRPDILASGFAAQVLNERPTLRPLTLTRVLDLAGLKAWENMIRFAQDLFTFTDFHVEDWVRPIVASRPKEELLDVDNRIPVQNPALAAWGVDVVQSLLSRLVKGSETEAERARLHHNLGGHLATLGRREESLSAAERAVEIRERLARSNPAAYEPDLASSLNNLGNRYSALGRREEALSAAERAMEIYERLSGANPAAYEPDLASSLNNLGNLYSALGRREEALSAAERAVEIYERLARANPAAYEPVLAKSYGAKGNIHREAGQNREAALSFLEGIRRLSPHFLRLPQAFKALMQNLLRDYLTACKEAGLAPNKKVLAPILKKLSENQ